MSTLCQHYFGNTRLNETDFRHIAGIPGIQPRSVDIIHVHTFARPCPSLAHGLRSASRPCPYPSGEKPPLKTILAARPRWSAAGPGSGCRRDHGGGDAGAGAGCGMPGRVAWSVGGGWRGAAWGHGAPPPGGGGRGAKSGGGWRICICSRKFQGPELL